MIGLECQKKYGMAGAKTSWRGSGSSTPPLGMSLWDMWSSKPWQLGLKTIVFQSKGEVRADLSCGDGMGSLGFE